jgi:hypothetical protein
VNSIFLRVFENRVLRRVFGPKRNEVTGEWRMLHNEELNDLYSLPKNCKGAKIEKNEVGGACGTYGGGERGAQGVSGET